LLLLDFEPAQSFPKFYDVYVQARHPRNNTLANLEDGAQILTDTELPELLGKQRDGRGGKQRRFLGLFEPIDEPRKPNTSGAPSAQKGEVAATQHWYDLPESARKALFVWPAGEKFSLSQVQKLFAKHGLDTDTDDVRAALNHGVHESWIEFDAGQHVWFMPRIQ
jgi:hypothetical protein